jgi:trehalose 6-phosphate phosphatase
MARHISELPHAIANWEDLERRLEGKRPAIFLDYDGTLTPIVERPENAIISERMRESVRTLAERFPVCVVSGRDRPVVQELMGLNNLIVAGSHGFDIWSPEQGTIEREEGGGEFEELLEQVRTRLHEVMDPIEGALVEPKKASVAAHFRLVSEDERHKIKDLVDEILAAHPDRLKVTPGKMVYEIQPKVDWDKGKAVLYLLEALDLKRDDVVPIYLGDDVTDEDAFRALKGIGIGIFVGRASDPEVGGRTTAADYVLNATDEVGRFLETLCH